MRSRKRLWLLAVPPALFAIVWAVAAVLFAHRPWAIPPELRAPSELVPGAQPGLRLKYTGITGYEITDGDTVLLVDPVLTRPTVNDLVSGPLAVDDAAVADAFPRADFILVNHAHFEALRVVDAGAREGPVQRSSERVFLPGVTGQAALSFVGAETIGLSEIAALSGDVVMAGEASLATPDYLVEIIITAAKA